MPQTHNSTSFDMTSLVAYAYKWRKPLIVVTLLAIVLAVVFSSPLFLKPKYKGVVIMYATKTYSLSKSLMGEKYSPDVLQFGEEEEAEQLIQLINSDDVRDRLISKYDLINHYELDTTSKTLMHNLYKTMEDNISIDRTQYMSVKVEVLDENPEYAAAMANDISVFVDSAWNSIMRERSLQALDVLEVEYNRQVAYMNTLEDSLTAIRQKGVFAYDKQSKELERAYVRALADYNQESGELIIMEKEKIAGDKELSKVRAKKSGAQRALGQLESKKQIAAQYGGAYDNLFELLRLGRVELTKTRVKYEEARLDAEKTLPPKFVVNHAVVPDKKAYPVRWLMVVLSAFAAFTFTLVVAMLLESSDSIKSRIDQIS